MDVLILPGFGEAAAVCLEHFLHSPNTSKLCALIAYYPTRIIDPELAYPSSVRVLVHFAAQDVTVVYPSSGRAHKSQREVRRITSAMGTGDRLSVGYQAYVYSGSLPGFAEKDSKQYSHISAQLAWSRSLKALQLAFHREIDLEAVWDEAQQGMHVAIFFDLSILPVQSLIIVPISEILFIQARKFDRLLYRR